MRNRKNQGFTLVEILIVVVILGILAAIVVPQFTNASQSATVSSIESQLQTVRGQLELFRIQEAPHSYPDLINDQWDTMLDPNGDGDQEDGYLQEEPVNPWTGTSLVAAAEDAGPPATGWVWVSPDFTAAYFDEDTRTLQDIQ
ncbi:MAG TPA: prepilin-type N-terminal cleavage/methylation domain-containing protein [Phycisphaeraceae bacterium]|nr:prepilin-type N-terminal cleavage/methylation domain-containing protein [Phycisphaeraceae bacterium]